MCERLVAPIAHDLRQRDLYRTHRIAAPAEARRVRQIAGLRDPVEPRVERRAERARIHSAIGVPAYDAVDRTMVHARAAADALEHFARGTVQNRTPPVVH